MSVIHQKRSELAPAPEFPVRPIPMERLTNGLLVRVPNWLGDAVMTLPALRILKKMLPPEAPLTVICPPSVRGLFLAVPIVDRLLVLSAPHQAWTAAECRAIRRTGIRIGVLFTNSFRDTLTLRRIGVCELYGAAARFRSFLLRRSCHFPEWQAGRLNYCHHARRYVALAESLGAPKEPLAMPEILPQFALDALPLKIQALARHPKLLCLAPGAAYGAAKRWSSESFRTVAERYIRSGGIVVILGSASERRIGEEIAAGLPAGKIVNLSGETEFTELLHLLMAAKLCVANDSGLMHLAAALGTPGVAVFGPTDYSATGPVADNWTLLFAKQNCSPCFKRECPTGTRKCMAAIRPQMVLEAMAALEKTPHWDNF